MSGPKCALPTCNRDAQVSLVTGQPYDGCRDHTVSAIRWVAEQHSTTSTSLEAEASQAPSSKENHA